MTRLRNLDQIVIPRVVLSFHVARIADRMVRSMWFPFVALLIVVKSNWA